MRWLSAFVPLPSSLVATPKTACRLRSTIALPAMASKNFKIALVQLKVGADKNENLARARQKLEEAANHGASLLALPECFNSPYGTSYFPKYAEMVPGGPSYEMLSTTARQLKRYIIGGSIPEQDGDSYYNTSLIFDPEGNLVAKHRKVHLFDIDVPGKIRFQESEILKPGGTITQFQTPFAKIGVGICYDIRFPELAMISARDARSFVDAALATMSGCDVMVYPGAFNMTTGPAHWELLQRARALDNQIYVAAVSPARDTTASYIAWGHSTVVNPWGEVIATTEHDEAIVYADIDLDRADEIRKSIPVNFQRRPDLYTLTRVQ